MKSRRRVNSTVRCLCMNLGHKIALIVQLVAIWIGCWVLGAVPAAFIDVWHPPFRSFDLEWFVEALAWSFVTAFLGVFVVQMPLMFLLRWIVGGVRPIVLFVIAGAAGSFVLTTFFYFSNKIDWVPALFSFQSLPYHVLFSVAGVLFALGFVWSLRAAPNKSLDASRDSVSLKMLL
jgi:hypothetical protein